MPDDKSKRGPPDRRRVSLEDSYEVNDLADRHGVSPERVREAIERAGSLRQDVEIELLREKSSR